MKKIICINNKKLIVSQSRGAKEFSRLLYDVEGVDISRLIFIVLEVNSQLSEKENFDVNFISSVDS